MKYILVQPNDQISLFLPYPSELSTSGAIQYGDLKIKNELFTLSLICKYQFITNHLRVVNFIYILQHQNH